MTSSSHDRGCGHVLADRPLIGRNQVRVVTRVVDNAIVAAVAPPVVMVMMLLVGCQGAGPVAMVTGRGGAGDRVLVERVPDPRSRPVLDQVAADAPVAVVTRRRHGYHVAGAPLLHKHPL